MTSPPLRVALFSGNYNYVRDGANQALNRLVGYLLRQGVAVRVYSPTTDTPAFEPAGDLVSLPSRAFPGRGEYRFPLGISADVLADLDGFAPNLIHVSSPDVSAHSATRYAKANHLPIVASVHTRFDTYPRYYGLSFLEPILRAMLRRFYRRCAALLAPSESFASVLREQRMSDDIGIWARGIDKTIFYPSRRDEQWRKTLGIAPDEVAIGFLGRLVMEKGLDVFADAIDALRACGVAHRVLVIGEGPARDWFEKRLPDAAFAGFQAGADLGRAVASMDMLFNPSITETFGNVTLEAMACGIPVVAARATGSENLVQDGITGRLVNPTNIDGYADALAQYCEDDALRTTHGAAGLAASAPYDWDAINQVVLDTYERVLRTTSQKPG
jgi:phosphatidylinositol alpha 1,6-mannosyltransferase